MSDPATCFHGNQPPCQECADEERVLRQLRKRAARIVTAADEAMDKLATLVTLLAEVCADESYQEWYRIFGDDQDALDDLMDAQRAIRSFARIARERTVRTERQP